MCAHGSPELGVGEQLSQGGGQRVGFANRNLAPALADTTWRRPPAAVATTGLPQAIASNTVSGLASP